MSWRQYQKGLERLEKRGKVLPFKPQPGWRPSPAFAHATIGVYLIAAAVVVYLMCCVAEWRR